MAASPSRTSTSPSPICEEQHAHPRRTGRHRQRRRHALTELINNPEVELTGVWVSSEAKVGKDAAELAGLDTPTSIKAIPAVVAAEPGIRTTLDLPLVNAKGLYAGV
jgi:hypothetical protein